MPNEMTSRERVFCALERDIPDRVPLYEAVIDERVMKNLLPGCDYDAFNDWIGLDMAGLNRSSWQRDNVEFIDEGKRFFRDKWGVIRGFGPESTPYPVKGPIERPEDLKAYQPPDPDDPEALGRLPEIVSYHKGKKAICWIGRDAFFNPSFLRGVEVIVLGDDYADKNGPLMSPEHFREFILLGLKRAVESAHRAGAYVVKHSDGNIWPLLDMIVDLGVDAINPIEPAPGMEIGEVKALYGARVSVIGNIDCVEFLSRGQPYQVREAVRACLKAAALNGGHILSSSNSIHSSVKPENYLAMVKALREFGTYPLKA